MSQASFNDDDVYIYNVASKEIVRTISCKDSQVRDSRYAGLRVMAGEAWAKGMTAKSLGLRFFNHKTALRDAGGDPKKIVAAFETAQRVGQGMPAESPS